MVVDPRRKAPNNGLAGVFMEMIDDLFGLASSLPLWLLYQYHRRATVHSGSIWSWRLESSRAFAFFARSRYIIIWYELRYDSLLDIKFGSLIGSFVEKLELGTRWNLWESNLRLRLTILYV